LWDRNVEWVGVQGLGLLGLEGVVGFLG
jgi:hypothetical protein